MEVNKREEERRSRREDEEKEDQKSLLNSPCSACNKVVESILKCLGLESSPPSSVEEEEDPGIETVEEERGFMARIIGVLRRRPRPPYSSGGPGQHN